MASESEAEKATYCKGGQGPQGTWWEVLSGPWAGGAICQNSGVPPIRSTFAHALSSTQNSVPPTPSL